VTIRRIGAETKAEAKASREKILAKEAALEEMVKEKSIEEDAAQGGTMGPVPEGAFKSVNPEFEKAVFETLELKQVSEPLVVTITQPPLPGEDGEEAQEQESETRWVLVEVLQRTKRIPATWDTSWFAVMQQAIYQPEYYEKISQEIAKLKGAASIEVFPPKYGSLNLQYESLKQSQPMRFGAPGKAEPGETQPALPGTAPPTKAPAKTTPPVKTEPPAKTTPPAKTEPSTKPRGPAKTAPSKAAAPAKPRMQPFRSALEDRGATVEWSQAGRVATAQLGDRTVRVKVGSASATIDGRQVRMAAPAELRGDRVWVSQEVLTEVGNAAPRP